MHTPVISDQILVAEYAILQDENELMFKQNDVVKRRRSTMSSIGGLAKVVSCEEAFPNSYSSPSKIKYS